MSTGHLNTNIPNTCTELSPDGGSIRTTYTHTRHNDDGMMILMMMLMIITGTDICKYI